MRMSIGGCTYHKLIYNFGSFFFRLGGFPQEICREQETNRRRQTSRKVDACSVFLQIPTQDEHSFTLGCNGDFLGKVDVPCPDSVEVLDVPALCKHDINLEAITNLNGRA